MVHRKQFQTTNYYTIGITKRRTAGPNMCTCHYSPERVMKLQVEELVQELFWNDQELFWNVLELFRYVLELWCLLLPRPAALFCQLSNFVISIMTINLRVVDWQDQVRC
jgi:hypothetical protein